MYVIDIHNVRKEESEMKLGIMQPYFLPYIGYWQLMNQVDKYVVYDDVNYIKGGWINRNRILVNDGVHYLNLQMIGASPNKLINEVGVNRDIRLVNRNLRLLENAYRRAPHFQEAYELMERIFSIDESNVALYNMEHMKIICNYLGIETELILSSELEKRNELKGQDKVLHICELLKATEYYNAIGGQDLYSFEAFAERGIQLKFIKTNDIQYKQFGETFYPNLSILDVIMFNSREEVQRMLNEYTLVMI